MRNIYLKRIKKLAFVYNLDVDYIAVDTLKVFSRKYNFDSWLIKEFDTHLELWHSNKIRKCNYHLQSYIRKNNWKWCLQRIDSHNKYKTTFSRPHQINVVDRVMKKYNNGGVA